MNIFYLDHNPKICAAYHNDKHVVKMILEYAQLLSTAHRELDGEDAYVKTLMSDGEINHKHKKIKLLESDSIMRERNTDDKILINKYIYMSTHKNHPCAKWVRESSGNYKWLYDLFVALLDEYTYRYEKLHATSRLKPYLKNPPKNIPDGKFVEPPLAITEDCKVNDVVKSYRNYYCNDKQHLAKWTRRPTPHWFYYIEERSNAE